MTKRMWYDIEPVEAVTYVLPASDVQGPYNENGEPCPWPWEPIQLKGQPLGQYRCGYCNAMVVAGMHHVDYGRKDGYGLTWIDYCYMDDARHPDPASIDRWETDGGAYG